MSALRYCLALAACMAAAGCAATPPSAPTTNAPMTQLANPASKHCVDVGGKLVIEQGEGGEMGVCVFEDNRQCEEWALMRGRCPVGGIRVTGYATPAARHCAIAGGRYTITARSGMPDEQGTCDPGR